VAVDIDGRTAKDTVAAIATTGRRSLSIQADMGSVQDIDRMVAGAIAAFGRIDILVNNAGVTRRAYIMDLTEEDWDRIHRVNAKGVFFCLQRVAREMIPRRSGRVINIASIAGKGFAGTSNATYAASKGAVSA
jgi:NAD(P)-dependent dehydrogenase (short-subunit alcohol dehydrogenase family)